MLKQLIITIIAISIFSIAILAQSDSDITIEGTLNKSVAENTYSIGDYRIQLPIDKKDSYKFYYDIYVGQQIKFRGKLIAGKSLEGDDIWYDGNIEPTKADYPQILQTGKSIEDFIPKDWVILQQASGDLNGDKLDDIVLAIRGNDLNFFRFSHDVRGKAQFLTNPITNINYSGTDGNPRILLVLLKEKEGYNLLLQNNTFLPISRFGIGESLNKIEIKNGEIAIDFSYGDPHWGFISQNSSFKFVESDMTIINYKTTKNLRYGASGIFDYDFLKMQVKITRSPKDEKEIVKSPETRTITSKKPLNLNTIPNLNELEKLFPIEF